MPGPPPPPPPGAPPPMMPPTPAPFFSSGGPDDRGALLQSIRKGTKLKKAVTNDKSAPVIGKVSSSSSSSGGGSVGASPSFRGGANNVPNGLGGLFAGGMPKLKPTGKNLGGSSNTVSSSNNSSSRTTPESPSSKSVSNIQNELKKQMANDTRNMNRGPPPPAPIRTYNNGDDTSSRQPFGTKNGSSNGFHQNPSLPNLSSPQQLAPHQYHRKTNSSVSLHTVDSGSDIGQNNNPKPVINHGKPNLAPKPPVLNGSKPAAPPKKLMTNGKLVGRTQSMRSPRSPSPQSPDNNNPDFVGHKFGTVRSNISQALANQNFGQSLGNLSQVKPRPPLNGRPTAPPPSIPNTPPPPPPNKMVKPPNHAPPPPPTVAPPPPPHRTAQQPPARPPPVTPNAPPPPPRHSSMRDGGNGRRLSSSSASTISSTSSFEARFNFHSITEFPRPMPFRGLEKVYNTRPAGGKPQAPPPPTQIQLSNRLWESSTC